jgi:hypothetical protein
MLDLVLHVMCVQNLCPALKAGQFEPEDGLLFIIIIIKVIF